MGCACVNPNTGANTFISLDQQHCNDIEHADEIETAKNGVKAQPNLRAIMNKKPDNDGHQELINKFLLFVNNSSRISFITNEDFLRKIPEGIDQAKHGLSSKIELYEQVINDAEINNNATFMIQACETSPVCYDNSSEEKEYYKGGFYYNEANDTFVRCGRGMIVDSEGNITDCQWSNDNIKDKSPGIIYYVNKNCYLGEVSSQRHDHIVPVPNGKGILYNASNNYSDFKEETWDHGRLCESNQHDPSQISKRTNVIITNIKGIDSIEKGEDNDSIIIIKYTNGNRYEGEFVIHNDHYIPNGNGTLFIPTESSDMTNGKYYISKWLNGQQTGPGEIKTVEGDYTKTLDCLFRFGKVIQSTSKLVKSPIKIHKNILHFISHYDHMHLAHSLKTKSMLLFIKENNHENLTKIRQAKIFCADMSRYPHTKSLYNKDLINADISNLDTVLENYTTNHSQFIPIVGYRTTGGMVEARFRYNNIFNPLISKMYSTNYLFHTDKDVEIDGVINHTFFQELNPQNEPNEHDPIEINQAYLRKRTTISDKDNLIQDDLIGQGKTYIEQYEKLEGKYSIQKYKAEIEDKEIVQSLIGNIDKVVFAVHAVIIQLPKQVDHYTYLTNPVRHLAIYVSNEQTKEYANEEDNMTDALLSKYAYSVKEVYEKYKKQSLLLTENDIYSMVEFDSGKEGHHISSKSKRRLVALVEIKTYNQIPIFLRFKKYYHTGKFITVKLLTQTCLYESKKVCIDMGTIHFYGQVFHTKKTWLLSK